MNNELSPPVVFPSGIAAPAAEGRAPRWATRRLTHRSLQLVAGLVLFAASIAMLVRAGLGNMPWDVLSQGISRQLGWSFGTVTITLSVVVLIGWIPLRQRPGSGTVANVIVIGLLVDPFLALARLIEPLPLWGAVALTAGGILTNGVATACYIGTRLGPGPRDGLMTGIVGRTGASVRLVRFGIEGVVVIGGWLLGGTLGLGTLAYAVLIGPLVHELLPRFTVRDRDRVATTAP
ncbi:hypothetical protein [Pengzhenrongella sp.]|uniref:membrane protein YczE n=1 Tax=Pengzhenrongella sp. TaxID=2888820 RepID=UPI002F91EE3A